MGLEEGRHFTAKMPEEGRYGYVRILRKGLERAAWLSVYGSEEQRKLAAEFVEYNSRGRKRRTRRSTKKPKRSWRKGYREAS